MVGKLFTLCLLYSITVLAVPTSSDGLGMGALFVRQDEGSSESNPIQANIDITSWPSIAEENCYILLCKENGKRVYQRVANPGTDNDQNRKDSGAAQQPYKKDREGTQKINDDTTSAEECPWASTKQGGNGAHIMPAHPDEQKGQGRSLSRAYRTYHIGPNKWFKITFTGNLGPNCKALFASTPDKSICTPENESKLFGKSIKPGEVISKANQGKPVTYHGSPPTSPKNI